MIYFAKNDLFYIWILVIDLLFQFIANQEARFVRRNVIYELPSLHLNTRTNNTKNVYFKNIYCFFCTDSGSISLDLIDVVTDVDFTTFSY